MPTIEEKLRYRDGARLIVDTSRTDPEYWDLVLMFTGEGVLPKDDALNIAEPLDTAIGKVVGLKGKLRSVFGVGELGELRADIEDIINLDETGSFDDIMDVGGLRLSRGRRTPMIDDILNRQKRQDALALKTAEKEYTDLFKAGCAVVPSNLAQMKKIKTETVRTDTYLLGTTLVEKKSTVSETRTEREHKRVISVEITETELPKETTDKINKEYYDEKGTSITFDK